MNRDDAIRMAQEAGLLLAVYRESVEHLQSFADIAYTAGAKAERDACAKILESVIRAFGFDDSPGAAGLHFALEDIRARGQK